MALTFTVTADDDDEGKSGDASSVHQQSELGVSLNPAYTIHYYHGTPADKEEYDMDNNPVYTMSVPSNTGHPTSEDIPVPEYDYDIVDDLVAPPTANLTAGVDQGFRKVTHGTISISILLHSQPHHIYCSRHPHYNNIAFSITSLPLSAHLSPSLLTSLLSSPPLCSPLRCGMSRLIRDIPHLKTQSTIMPLLMTWELHPLLTSQLVKIKDLEKSLMENYS